MAESHSSFADFSKLGFVDATRAPVRVLKSLEGARITERLKLLKEALGDNLERVDLYPNVGHVSFGTGEVLNGVVYYVKKGTPVEKLLPFLGPLYQRLSVVNFGALPDNKIEKLRKAWAEIVDPSEAKGSGIVGRGRNVHDEIDLFDVFEKRNPSERPWYTSLGGPYPNYAILARGQDKDAKLVVACGHEQLHKKLYRLIVANKAKVEDIAERGLSLDTVSSLVPVIKMIKELQNTNHRFIAGKVRAALDLAGVPREPFTTFDIQEPEPYGYFYNTVHATSNSKIFSITQGVANVDKDVPEEVEGRNPLLYIVENPLKVHEVEINTGKLGAVHYFPVTTGSSEFYDFGQSIDERRLLSETVHLTGVSNISHIGNTYFQPYDVAFRSTINDVLAGKAYEVVKADRVLQGLIYSTAGFDVRRLIPDRPPFDQRQKTITDVLECTKDMKNNDIIIVPVASAAVELIYNTFSTVVGEVKKETNQVINLPRVMDFDPDHPLFVRFPIGVLRYAVNIAENAANAVVDTANDIVYGMAKIIL